MSEYQFQIDGVGSLDVRIPSGKIDIKDGPAGQVSVELAGSGAGDVIVEQRGSTISIASKRQGGFLVVDRDVYVTAMVPAGTDIRANVASADMYCDGAMGHITFNSASGDLRFGRAVELDAKTASGDLRGATVHERLHFVSASGDLHLGELTGRAEISTASGDMHADRVEASTSVSTMSGDIHIREFAGEEFSSKSMSGNVRLGIPEGTRVDLDANSFSGKIRLPERKTPGSSDVSVRTSRIGVKLVSGDLTIKRA